MPILWKCRLVMDKQRLELSKQEWVDTLTPALLLYWSFPPPGCSGWHGARSGGRAAERSFRGGVWPPAAHHWCLWVWQQLVGNSIYYNGLWVPVAVFVCRAVGNRTYGSLYQDQITESLRKTAEHCDCLQSFFVIHSMGGGRSLVFGLNKLLVFENCQFFWIHVKLKSSKLSCA